MNPVRRTFWVWAPLAVLAIALALRLYGLDWDQGRLFHPDERAVLMKVESLSFPPLSKISLLLDAKESPLNPHWFAYGTLPMYLLKVAEAAFSPLEKLNVYGLRFPGRALSALADVGTVLAVLALGTRLYGRRVGLLAAALTAVAVLHVQLAHFFAVDTFATFFAVLSLFFMARVVQGGGLRHSALAGLFLGLAIASKTSIAFLVLPFLFTHGLRAFSKPGAEAGIASPSWKSTGKGIAGVAIGITVALAAVFATMPYAFLDWSTFLHDVIEQSEIIRRVRDVPYTLQYVNTPSYVYHLQQTTLWGLGIPLGVAAWGGLLFVGAFALARRHVGDLLLLSWVVPYFLFFGQVETKFLRYLLPITPFLVLMGARMLIWAWDANKGKRAVLKWATGAAIAVVLASTAVYALSYVAIYSRPHPAVQASRWVNANAPEGATLLKEHWEEALPDLGRYNLVELPLYEPDTDSKLAQVTRQLSQADYVIFYSNRLYGTIPRLPQRYPLTSAYYRALFSGDLGYTLAASFTSYPGISGIALVDDTFRRPGLPTPIAGESTRPAISLRLGFADESFTVYDHPKVLVFQRVRDMSPGEMRLLIQGYATPAPEPLGLMMSPEEAQAQQNGGAWSDIIHPQSLANRFPLVAWLALVEMIALATLPLCLVLLRRLPDKGFLLAKGLGLLLVAYAPWLLASLHWMAFSRGSILVAISLVAAASLVFAVAFRRQIVDSLRRHWGIFLFSEALFLTAFLSFTAIRMANPDLWHPWRGGEKPMDFAYLNATLRSTYMPPYDPWFAGGYLNYYYFGMVPVATLIKATGIVPTVAYNLAIPMFFALTATLAFSLVYNLTALLREHNPGPRRSSWGPVLAGVTAALLVVVLANLDGMVQLLQGAWTVVVRDGAFPQFDYWRSTRMMPPQISITEFPFFTFLYADLHAHMEALPLTLVGLGLGLGIIVAAQAKDAWWARALLIGLLALVVGALAAANTWDYPTYLGISIAMVFIGQIAHRGKLDGRALVCGGLFSVGLAVLSYVLFLPFHMTNVNFYNGVVPSKEQTPLYQYLGVHGLFIFLLATFMVAEMCLILARNRRRPVPTGGDDAVVVAPRTARRVGWVLPALTLATMAVALGVLVALHYYTVAFLGFLLAWAMFLAAKKLQDVSSNTPYNLLLLLLLGVALALGIAVDLVTVQGDIDRMNTVFKFYIQAWVLFGVASAVILWRVAPIFFSRSRRLWARGGKVLWLAFFALLVFAASVYPILGTRARLADRVNALPWTLDGAAYMNHATYQDPNGPLELKWDYQGILWLQENLQGSPVIAEGVTPLYRWGSRISVYTGLPTIVGWDWHQKQQRWKYRFQVEERGFEVADLYSTPDLDRAWALLHKYNVSYVYVGELERLYYPQTGIAKFDAMVGQGLELAYQNPGVKVYKVTAKSADATG